MYVDEGPIDRRERLYGRQSCSSSYQKRQYDHRQSDKHGPRRHSLHVRMSYTTCHSLLVHVLVSQVVFLPAGRMAEGPCFVLAVASYVRDRLRHPSCLIIRAQRAPDNPPQAFCVSEQCSIYWYIL